MKRMICIIFMVIILAGCSGKSTFETLGNPCLVEPVLTPSNIIIDLPDQCTQFVLSSVQNNELYLCDNYAVYIYKLAGGNLNETFRYCTGYNMEQLPIIETTTNNMKRYDSVCTTLGEPEEHVLRIAVIDDGLFHYVLCATTSAQYAGLYTETWNEMFASMKISTDQ